jgi:hypothetical protein
MTEHTTCVVIGAGPAGVALACERRRCNHCLAGPQVNEVDGLRRYAALFRSQPQRLPGPRGIGNDQCGVGHPCFHEGSRRVGGARSVSHPSGLVRRC